MSPRPTEKKRRRDRSPSPLSSEESTRSSSPSPSTHNAAHSTVPEDLQIMSEYVGHFDNFTASDAAITWSRHFQDDDYFEDDEGKWEMYNAAKQFQEQYEKFQREQRVLNRKASEVAQDLCHNLKGTLSAGLMESIVIPDSEALHSSDSIHNLLSRMTAEQCMDLVLHKLSVELKAKTKQREGSEADARPTEKKPDPSAETLKHPAAPPTSLHHTYIFWGYVPTPGPVQTPFSITHNLNAIGVDVEASSIHMLKSVSSLAFLPDVSQMKFGVLGTEVDKMDAFYTSPSNQDCSFRSPCRGHLLKEAAEVPTCSVSHSLASVLRDEQKLVTPSLNGLNVPMTNGRKRHNDLKTVFKNPEYKSALKKVYQKMKTRGKLSMRGLAATYRVRFNDFEENPEEKC